MNSLQEWETAAIAGVRPAASALLPRATSLSTRRSFPLKTPQPIPPLFLPRTSGARQESPGRCGPAPAPARNDLNATEGDHDS
jgi:hypothetical protein